MTQNALFRREGTFDEKIQSIKKQWETYRASPEVESNDRKNWAVPYVQLRARGFAYLQRRRRLIEERDALYSSTKLTTRQHLFSVLSFLRSAFQRRPQQSVGADDKKLPSYETACRDAAARMDQKIQQLLESYWNTRETLWDMDSEIVRSEIMAKVKTVWNWYDQGGRLYAWDLDCGACASTGGCCGRDCGCCEKPLITYWEPMKQHDAESRKLVGVYGHCTAECPCCIRVRGRYHPHPRLPPLDV
ncbi:hypothetical protein BDW42DRAFT_159053 [Aspergillus taichungensis]|uniref:Uncharacterized protein n=1 Tax=Aspergillus taichungensis TaxID=482145 RepID=A0A2J5I8S3_9EURO|nr:hypothetical protein BDW42DRAFT_159053 [Aspergillus taichungensis]